MAITKKVGFDSYEYAKALKKFQAQHSKGYKAGQVRKKLVLTAGSRTVK